MTTVSRYEPGPADRRSFSWHAPRSRGAVSGLLLLLLGIWAALMPMVGPMFRFAYTPDTAWDLTSGRLWLQVLPGIAVALAGLGLLIAAHRAAGIFWAWIGLVAGAWILVGPSISRLWNHGESALGNPIGASNLARVVQEVGLLTGLGAAIVALSALALGRFTVVGVRDVRRAESANVPTQRAEDQHVAPAPTRAPTPTPTETQAPPVSHGTGGARQGGNTGSTELNQP